MRFLQNAVLAALKRVQLFLDDNVAVLAAIVDLTAARKRRSARSGEHICESIDVPRSCSSNCGALMNGFGAPSNRAAANRDAVCQCETHPGWRWISKSKEAG